MKKVLDRLIGLGTQRPRGTLIVAALLAVICAAGALTLQPSAGITTLVSSSSADYRSTQTDAQQFGAAPVVVLVQENLTDLLDSTDIVTLSKLEACLDGQEVVLNNSTSGLGSGTAYAPVPAASAKPYGGANSPCGHLMSSKPAHVVYGPATFLNQAVVGIYAAINALEKAGDTAEITQLAEQAGITSLPAIDSPDFINAVVFDSLRGVEVPKARFSYLFPTPDAGLIQVRLRANLNDAQTADAIRWIRAAVKMPMFRLHYGGTYTVGGEPVVLNDLSTALSGQVALLLIGAVIVMAVVLLLVYRRRLRLLPLALALASAAITFGLLALAGGTLTMASIAVLPILIGLAVDYGIQFQSRASGAATILAAALATATGFLVLLLSPVPMVQGFGLLLVIGVGVAFVVVMCVGSAVLVLPPLPAGSLPSVPGGADLAASVRGAGEIVADLLTPLARFNRFGSWDLDRSLARVRVRPRTVLAVGLVLAVAGWVLDTQTPVQSDVTKLVPSNLPALKNLDTLERVSGSSGEVDVLVHAKDVATAPTVRWMVSYENEMTKHFGYVETKGCKAATVCPALSLPDLLTDDGTASASGLSQSQITGLLAALPGYLSAAVVSPNHTYTNLAFGIRLMPLAEQVKVIAYMRSHLNPPAGVTAQIAGLPVLAADADGSLSSASRRMLTLLAGLIAVGLVLTAIFRDRRRALIPLAPIVLATGWSALIVWLIGIPLNPMSATLGALVIAISTEFSVLLAERYRRERRSGTAPDGALAAAYRTTGLAVLCSGITAIAGFGVLIVSDVTMLRDFGLVTLIDMSVSLLGVLAVLPAVLALTESEEPVRRAESETVVV